jgi:hypothetical protein
MASESASLRSSAPALEMTHASELGLLESIAEPQVHVRRSAPTTSGWCLISVDFSADDILPMRDHT